jgi:hypothetical protein
LEQDRRFRDPAVRDSQTESLAFEIRRRAAGVFLWVHLVVWELLRGLSEEDEIDMLQTRLDMLPKSLEEFFAHIVKSMEQVCRKYTARSLMLAHRAREPLPVMAYAFLYLETSDMQLFLQHHSGPEFEPEMMIAQLFVAQAKWSMSRTA